MSGLPRLHMPQTSSPRWHVAEGLAEARAASIPQRAGGIRIDISKLEVVMRRNGDTALTTFGGTTPPRACATPVTKVLEWKKINGQWQIVREVARSVAVQAQ